MRRFAVLLVASSLLAGCEGLLPRAEIAFTLPRERFYDFLDVPWPHDVLRTDDGIDLSAFPNPYDAGAIDDYVADFSTSPGYASSSALYFRADGGVDETSLPASPRESVSPASAMFLVELDDPHRRLPIEWRTYADGTSFLPPGSVAVLPMLGVSVDGPAALVVTSGARSSDGRSLGPSADLLALLRCEPIDGVDHAPDCAPYAKLAEDTGLAPHDIALVQMFTPQDATTELVRAYEWLIEQDPPEITDIERVANQQFTAFVLFTGTVELAQFQRGTPPYGRNDGAEGGFEIGDDGVPVVQRAELVEFTLTVPLGDEPEAGWPIVINGHGTGGSLNSGVGNGPSNEAHQLARAGCAMLSTSEPLHRGRAGFTAGSEDILTFNFFNPTAGRDNWRQSTLEKVQLISAARNIQVPATVAGRLIRFDPEQVHYFGHSQGGIVGSILMGVEQRIGGAFLSGAGAGFATSLIDKTEPVDMREVVRTLTGTPDGEEIDRFHPIPNLMQIWVEPLEPLNYGRLWRERETGRVPHLVATSGLMDQYTPPRTHAGLAAGFGLPTVKPVAQRLEVAELLGITPIDGPASGNRRGPGGEPVTAGLLQYPDDGHFAVFYNPDAQEAYRLFFETVQQGTPVARTE